MGTGGGRISCLPHADPKASEFRLANGVMAREGVGRTRDSTEEKGRGAVGLLGAPSGLRRCLGEGAEEKSEPRHPRLSESK